MASDQPRKILKIYPKSLIQNGKPKFPDVCAAERDSMCQLDLKDAYLHVSLHQNSQISVLFVCFGLVTAPRISFFCSI